MTASDSSRRVAELVERGVQVVAPEQVFVGADVDLTRIATGATLHPGTRLYGPRTFVAAGAHVGKEGPATLDNAVLGKNASIASGYVRGAVLLDDAQLGFAAHVREGTLLEEQASTGHAVGLKQSILLSFATLGSLINFCDALIAGGTSRRDHSEIGSGFIHFNFTPWGEHGDKATPSLIGDVVDGVFLDQARIFLGGNSGLIGPRRGPGRAPRYRRRCPRVRPRAGAGGAGAPAQREPPAAGIVRQRRVSRRAGGAQGVVPAGAARPASRRPGRE